MKAQVIGPFSCLGGAKQLTLFSVKQQYLTNFNAMYEECLFDCIIVIFFQYFLKCGDRAAYRTNLQISQSNKDISDYYQKII